MKTTLFKLLDTTVGSLLCKILSLICPAASGQESIPCVPKRILIIRPGGIGDMLLLLPTIRALEKHYPDAVIEILCEKRNADVLDIANLKHKQLRYDANPISLITHLLRTSYDVCLDTEQFHNFSAIFGTISGAPCRIGFKINPRRNPLYTHLINYSPDGSEMQQFLRLLEPLSISKNQPDSLYKIKPPENELPQINEFISLHSGSKLIALHPGANVRHKQWTTMRYSELINEMNKHSNFVYVLLGGKKEIEDVKLILNSSQKKKTDILDLSGKLNLSQTATAIHSADLLIGPDSGLIHLATALGTPSVALFGPSDHLKWGSCESYSTIVRHALPCSPCFIFGYSKPCKTIACMQNIQSEEVANAAIKLLETAQSRG